MAMTLIAVSDGIAKHLMESYPPPQVVWARFMAHFATLAPFAIYIYRGKLLRQFKPGAQIVRGGLMFLSVLLFMLSIAVIPLGRAAVLFSISPFVVALLSRPLLGEQTRAAHWACIAVGFGGVLLIARSDGDWQVANLLAASGGICYAFYLLASRKLSGGAPAIVGGFFASLVGTLAMTPLMPAVAIAPLVVSDIALFSTVGVLVALAHYFLIRAFDFAPAVFLAPFVYWEIAAASLVGALLHGDIPDIRDICGAAVIVAAGIALLFTGESQK